MLLEGMLATFVVVACGAGIALGFAKEGEMFNGVASFQYHYGSRIGGTGLATGSAPLSLG